MALPSIFKKISCHKHIWTLFVLHIIVQLSVFIALQQDKTNNIKTGFLNITKFSRIGENFYILLKLLQLISIFFKSLFLAYIVSLVGWLNFCSIKFRKKRQASYIKNEF